MRVYKYGLRAPTRSADLAADQLCGAHRYRNHLIEIEHSRRLQTETSRWGCDPDEGGVCQCLLGGLQNRDKLVISRDVRL